MPRIINMDNAVAVADAIEASNKSLGYTHGLRPIMDTERAAFKPMVLTSNGNYIQPAAR